MENPSNMHDFLVDTPFLRKPPRGKIGGTTPLSGKHQFPPLCASSLLGLRCSRGTNRWIRWALEEPQRGSGGFQLGRCFTRPGERLTERAGHG